MEEKSLERVEVGICKCNEEIQALCGQGVVASLQREAWEVVMGGGQVEEETCNSMAVEEEC